MPGCYIIKCDQTPTVGSWEETNYMNIWQWLLKLQHRQACTFTQPELQIVATLLSLPQSGILDPTKIVLEFFLANALSMINSFKVSSRNCLHDQVATKFCKLQ